MIYLLVDLKIALASILLIKIEADLKGALILGTGANSNRGAYQNLKSYGGGAKPRRGANSGMGAKPRKYGTHVIGQATCGTLSLLPVIQALPNL